MPLLKWSGLQPMTEKVYLSLGSNLGDPAGNLLAAVRHLALRGLKILDISGIYQTEPVGRREQPDFFNLALVAETCLDPFELLKLTSDIEENLGRVRQVHWGPRTIDIDILFYGDWVIRTPELVIPHPRISERAFVLVPLQEIDPQLYKSLNTEIPPQKIFLRTPAQDVKMNLKLGTFLNHGEFGGIPRNCINHPEAT